MKYTELCTCSIVLCGVVELLSIYVHCVQMHAVSKCYTHYAGDTQCSNVILCAELHKCVQYVLSPSLRPSSSTLSNIIGCLQ